MTSKKADMIRKDSDSEYFIHPQMAIFSTLHHIQVYIKNRIKYIINMSVWSCAKISTLELQEPRSILAFTRSQIDKHHSSIHYTAYPWRVTRVLEPFPADIEHEAGDIQDRSSLSINLTCMSLVCGRKPEYLERTHRAQGGHANSKQKGPSPQGMQTRNLLAVRQQY